MAHSRAPSEAGGKAFSHALNMSFTPGVDLGGGRRGVKTESITPGSVARRIEQISVRAVANARLIVSV